MASRDYSTIRSQVDQFGSRGECELKLCLDMTLYYDGSFKDNAPGIVHFYRRSLEIIGQDVKFYTTGDSTRLKKIKKDTLEMLPFWATNPGEDGALLGLTLESGPTAEDVSDKAFYLYGNRIGPGWLRLILPLEFMNHSAEQVVALAKDMASGIRFLSGYGGYGTNIDIDYPSSDKTWPVYTLSRRYQGIGFGQPLYLASFMKSSITCVNWLTWLGEAHVTRLGGHEQLRNNLGPNIIVHELPHGVLIQAGPEPAFGDIAQGETLPFYHQAGRALQALRIPKAVLRRYNGIGGSENTEEWLARFDH